MVRIKRVYEKAGAEDGCRILVDRLWPRGLSKEQARLDDWMRDIGPTDELRSWFGHDVLRWPQFVVRYRKELMAPARSACLDQLWSRAATRQVTLLYAARDVARNNAVVIRELLDDV